MLLAVTLLPALAAAEETRPSSEEVRAREHFAQGVRRMRAAEWPAAERAFRASHELFPTQAGLFNLGSSVLAQDRPVEALELFDRYLEEFRDRASESQIAEVGRMRDRALARLCRVTVDASPEGAEITVDGEPVGESPLAEPLLLVAGRHRFAASREGYQGREVERSLEGGCSGEAVAISLRPSRRRGRGDRGTLLLTVPRRGDDRRQRSLAVAGWVTLAMAGAAAVGASITGGLALSRHSEFTQMGLGEDWGPLQEEGRTLTLTTDILIGVAAALAATSIPLLIYGHRRPQGDTE